MRETTLCYIEQNDCYLMLHRTKKKADGSYEKWLGVGGKLEMGETPEQCVRRETLEETGYILGDVSFRAKIYFYSDLWEDEIMYLYTSSSFTGQQIPCDEGELVWVKKSEISSLNIWQGDKLFLERIAEESPYFELELRYKGDELISHKFM